MDIIKKINYIFDNKQKRGLAINAALALIASLLELLGVSALLPLVDVILDESLIEKRSLYNKFATVTNAYSVRDFVINFSLCLIVIYIIKNAYLMIRYYIQSRYIYSNQKILAINLMSCYLDQNYLFHVDHSAAELQRNVSNDVGRFMKVVSSIISMFVEMLTFAFIFVFLIVTDPITTVILATIFGSAFAVIFKVFKKNQYKAGKDARDAAGEMNKWVLQSFGGIKELKVLNREQFFLDNYDVAYAKSNKAGIKNDIFTNYPKYITEVLIVGGLLLTIIIRMMMGVDTKSFAMSLSAFAAAAMRMLPAFNRITEHVSTIMYYKPSVAAIYEDVHEANSLKKHGLGFSGDNKLELVRELKIEDVSFKYPEADRYVFTDANISIKKNKSIALIGESGAGKTTLADIMLGLLEPESGQVTVDGTDIYKHEDEWHRSVGYIPQMIYLIDDTIRTNITFGNEADDDRIWKALKDAQLEDFVKGLSKGLDTVVGDRGVKLSGGQRQRIGIARALYTDPSVLFLDEATSALDTETENAVMESINYLHGKTTMVIIAHRLTTIRNCDEIYQVGDGKIKLMDKKEVFEEESRKLMKAADK